MINARGLFYKLYKFFRKRYKKYCINNVFYAIIFHGINKHIKLACDSALKVGTSVRSFMDEKTKGGI